jgi:hypothetical protein
MRLASPEDLAPGFSSHPGEFRRQLVERSGLVGKTMVSRHRTEDFLRKDGNGHGKLTKRALRQLWQGWRLENRGVTGLFHWRARCRVSVASSDAGCRSLPEVFPNR